MAIEITVPGVPVILVEIGGGSLVALGTAVNPEWLMPDAAGTVGVLREYADSATANASVSVGDAWWDTTLKKVRVRLS